MLLFFVLVALVVVSVTMAPSEPKDNRSIRWNVSVKYAMLSHSHHHHGGSSRYIDQERVVVITVSARLWELCKLV